VFGVTTLGQNPISVT